MFWPDLVRLAIVIAGIFYGFAMLPVMILHYRAWRAIRTEDADAGLLPLHVALIAFANAVLAYALVSGNVAQMGAGVPFNWRLPLYLIGFILGIAALVIVAQLQRRRLVFERSPMTVRAEENSAITHKD